MTAARAQSTACASISDEKERLACFDSSESKLEAQFHGKELVLETLSDPNSAEFKDVFRSSFRGKDGIEATCGQVNAKNKFGGFVGFRKFYVVGGHVSIVDKSGEAYMTEYYEKLWKIVCEPDEEEPAAD